MAYSTVQLVPCRGVAYTGNLLCAGDKQQPYRKHLDMHSHGRKMQDCIFVYPSQSFNDI